MAYCQTTFFFSETSSSQCDKSPKDFRQANLAMTLHLRDSSSTTTATKHFGACSEDQVRALKMNQIQGYSN